MAERSSLDPTDQSNTLNRSGKKPDRPRAVGNGGRKRGSTAKRAMNTDKGQKGDWKRWHYSSRTTTDAETRCHRRCIDLTKNRHRVRPTTGCAMSKERKAWSFHSLFFLFFLSRMILRFLCPRRRMAGGSEAILLFRRGAGSLGVKWSPSCGLLGR